MALVIKYGVNSQTSTDFEVSFSIPVNCMYSLTTVTKTYYIKVQLQKGQTIPSSTYMPCTTTVTPIDDEVNVEFQQVLDGITNSKPKMKVDNCA